MLAIWSDFTFIVMDVKYQALRVINTTCADINCCGQNKTEKAQKWIADKENKSSKT